MPLWIVSTLSVLRRWVSGDPKRWLPLRLALHIAVMALAAALATILAGWVLGVRLPSAADQAAKPFEGIKIVLAIVAGFGGVIALTVAYRKQRLGETSEDREQSKHFHERFSAATEQLGSDKANIRSAGAYALAHLADDWDAGRQTCINVLCQYIRMPYQPPEKLDSSADPDTVSHNETRMLERQVRHTIMDIIGDRLRMRPIPGQTWHGHDFDFSSATIDGGDLSRAFVTGGRVAFRDAKFVGGDFQFSHARFAGGVVSFNGTEFIDGHVNFTAAEVTSGHVNFTAAEVTGGHVDFTNSKLTGGNIGFIAAKFAGGTVSLRNTEFSGGHVNFFGTDFTGGHVNFFGAKFTSGHVNFFGAKFTSDISFETARFAGATVDFRRVADWSRPPRFPDFPDGPPAGLLLPQNDESSAQQEDPKPSSALDLTIPRPLPNLPQRNKSGRQ